MTILGTIKGALNTDILSIGKKAQPNKHSSETVENTSQGVSGIINNGYTKNQLETYFNPVTSDFADINGLAKIIQGQVINPFKLKDPNSHTDCTFFVAGIFGGLSNLPIAFDSGSQDELYKCDWFGLFTINRNSQIVIPNKIVIEISEDKKSVDVNIVDKNVWSYGGGFFQLDKNMKKKIIKSDVKEEDMRRIIKKIYGDVMFL